MACGSDFAGLGGVCGGGGASAVEYEPYDADEDEDSPAVSVPEIPRGMGA